MKPTIGIVELGTDTEERRYFRQQYLDRLEACHAAVHMIAQHQEKAQMQKEVRACSGILLPGGLDLDPSLYGETVRTCCGRIDQRRDRAEYLLYQCIQEQAAAGRRLPVLGICRGIQTMNVLEGGTLYQDIGESGAKLLPHRGGKNPSEPLHRINIVPGTRLHLILGTEQCAVNSMHHQAVACPAKTMQICARSEDGLIEGLEKPNHPFFLGVQWHPEHMPEDRLQQKLFRAFVAAAESFCLS